MPMHGRKSRSRGPAVFRSHGRATVLTLLIVWVLTQIVLGRIIDASLWLRDPLYADKEIKLQHRIAARSTLAGRPYTVVVVGSSRTGAGVRGDRVEEVIRSATGRETVVINFGIPGAGPLANLAFVQRLLASADRPDLVVLEVVPPMLGESGEAPRETPTLSPERFRGAEIESFIRFGFPAEIAQRWWADELVPVYGHRFQLIGRAAHLWLPWNLRFESSRGTDETGWQKSVYATVTPATYERGLHQAHLEHFEALQRLRFDVPVAGAIGESLALCRKNGVTAALLLMPEGTAFRSWYPPPVEAAMYAFLDEIRRDHGAPLIDARRWMDDDAFSDSHHLIPVAAAAFSNRFGREIGRLIAAHDTIAARSRR
jgi:hypothetical protein